MIVEDERLLISAIDKKLKTEGFITQPFTSGKEALSSLASGQTIPDVIWLDYYLKDTNGLEFVTQIKRDDRLKNIPIVIVSNSASDKKIKSMLTLGANKYLLKSANKIETIIAEISSLLE